MAASPAIRLDMFPVESESHHRLVVIELGNGLADSGLVQELLLIDQTSHQSRGADLIDSSRQALGVFEDTSHCVVGEERASGVAGGTDVVPHIAHGLGQIERAEVVADGESLAESSMDREVQRVVQRGMAYQDDGRERLAVHLIAKQQSQLFQHCLGEQVVSAWAPDELVYLLGTDPTDELLIKLSSHPPGEHDVATQVRQATPLSLRIGPSVGALPAPKAFITHSVVTPELGTKNRMMATPKSYCVTCGKRLRLWMDGQSVPALKRE